MKKIRGFTLVELLAVIVILAIILVIAVPKIANVIENSKLGAITSSAKVILDAAYKKQSENLILENTSEITCDKVGKLNDSDYQSCDLVFDNNIPYITLVGKGKLEGYRCKGTKDNLSCNKVVSSNLTIDLDGGTGNNPSGSYNIGNVVTLENPEKLCYEFVNWQLVSGKSSLTDNKVKISSAPTTIKAIWKEVELPDYDKGTTYINSLYSNEVIKKCNGLKKDNTVDENLRYEGSDPKNYVSFNDELWRIIGVFGDNIKLIRSERLGALSWDTSSILYDSETDRSVNGGNGVNEWSQAKLKEYLNTMYYGGTSVTCYDYFDNRTATCPTGSLNATAKAMINNYTWNTGAINYEDTNVIQNDVYNTVAFYNAERGSVIGKLCSAVEGICNDTVTRTTTWKGYVALPYMTDWAYASSESVCALNMYQHKESENGFLACNNNNWIFNSDISPKIMWTLSPFAWASESDSASYVWHTAGNGLEDYSFYAAHSFSVFPTVYLNSNVEITGGTGTSSDPYILN